MRRGDVQMGVVDDCRGSGVQSFQTSSQLAPEHVFRGEIRLLEISCKFGQSIIVPPNNGEPNNGEGWAYPTACTP